MSGLPSPDRLRRASVVAAFALIAACASDPPSVGPVDRLLESERSAYAARTRDFDATLRFAARLPDSLEGACRREADARVRALEHRIRLAGLARLAHFESLVWSLQWAAPAGPPDEDDDASRRRLATADVAAEAARDEARSRPNDARLAAAAANAEALRARLRGDGLLAEREAARALAERIARLRGIVGARVDEVFDGLSDELREAGIASCRMPPVVDPFVAESRRAAYATVHTAQIEGLATLRVRHDRLADQPASVEAARNALAEGSLPLVAAIPRDSGFEAILERVEDEILVAERDLTTWIEARVGDLRNGTTTGM